MNPWEIYKKWFNAWEGATAQYMETVLKSPLVLESGGAWLSAMMKTKTAGDKLTAGLWGSLGLPTKRDQERALHKLNQLESRLLDIEERLTSREN